MSDPTQPPPALTSDWKEATEAAEAWWITDEEGRNHAIYCYRAGYLSAKRKADHDAKPSSASWSKTPPTGPGYFWSRSHGGTPVIAWYTADGVRMSCDQTVIVLDSDEGRDWMATQAVEFWPEPIVFYGSRRSSCNQRQVMAFDETDENGSRVGFEMIAFGSRIRIGVIRGRLPTLWFFAPPTVAARQWACPKGSWSMRVWRLSIARRPNHKVSHGQ